MRCAVSGVPHLQGSLCVNASPRARVRGRSRRYELIPRRSEAITWQLKKAELQPPQGAERSGVGFCCRWLMLDTQALAPLARCECLPVTSRAQSVACLRAAYVRLPRGLQTASRMALPCALQGAVGREMRATCVRLPRWLQTPSRSRATCDAHVALPSPTAGGESVGCNCRGGLATRDGPPLQVVAACARFPVRSSGQSVVHLRDSRITCARGRGIATHVPCSPRARASRLTHSRCYAHTCRASSTRSRVGELLLHVLRAPQTHPSSHTPRRETHCTRIRAALAVDSVASAIAMPHLSRLCLACAHMLHVVRRHASLSMGGLELAVYSSLRNACPVRVLPLDARYVSRSWTTCRAQ